MGQPEKLDITLPDDLLKFVRSKVSRGEFASESEVILDALEALRIEDEELERFEREVVVPTHEHLLSNPSSVVSADEVFAELEAARQRRLKAS
jgi:antitoxin ParD1/3/4